LQTDLHKHLFNYSQIHKSPRKQPDLSARDLEAGA
jgi:hypothetical protein